MPVLSDSVARFLFTTRQRLSQLGKTLAENCLELETIIIHDRGDILSPNGWNI